MRALTRDKYFWGVGTKQKKLTKWRCTFLCWHWFIYISPTQNWMGTMCSEIVLNNHQILMDNRALPNGSFLSVLRRSLVPLCTVLSGTSQSRITRNLWWLTSFKGEVFSCLPVNFEDCLKYMSSLFIWSIFFNLFHTLPIQFIVINKYRPRFYKTFVLVYVI